MSRRPSLHAMPHLQLVRDQEHAARILARQAGTRAELCEVCERPGAYGFNNFLRAPELAVFACAEHRLDVEAALS